MEEIRLHGNAKDLMGQVFGRLTVVKVDSQNKWGNYKWLCKCSCGVEKVVVGGNLTGGNSQSCGCLREEMRHTNTLQHGMTKTQEHYSWLDIKKRTEGRTEKYKRDYVDRGITMHPDFENFDIFYKEIGPKPDDGQIWSVGRIKNNLGYTYGNIRWETPDQQSRNKTRQTNNKTGVSGVSTNNNSYVAQSRQLNGKPMTKSFSINKYGDEEAFQLACAARKKMIEDLNAQGAGYSDDHGCEK